VPVVDSHCHVSPLWYEPVESLLDQMERNSVDHAVLIQMMGQRDNRYEFQCVQRFPSRFAPVVIVDIEHPRAAEDIVRLADEGASGVRLQAAARSPGDDPLAIWRAVGKAGVAVSCFGSATEFAAAAFAELIEALPDLPIVVEHLGSLGQRRTDPLPGAVADAVFALARFPNVTMKVTGLGEFSRRAMPVTEPSPFVEPVPDLLERALAAFGANRLMWGSDYPPVSSREGYRNALNWPRERLAHLTSGDLDAIFGGTALRVFPVRT
jgi:L-fuconolactonase